MFFTISSPEIYFAIFKICLLLILPFSQLLPFWARTKTRTGSGRFRRSPSHFPQNRFPCFSCSTKRALSARLQDMIYIWTERTCLFTVPKMFCAGPNFWASPKIYLHIVPVTNILCQTKRWFAFSKIGFCASTKVFEESLNAVKVLGWHKTFWDL